MIAILSHPTLTELAASDFKYLHEGADFQGFPGANRFEKSIISTMTRSIR